MNHLEILTEEPSMENVLNVILPKLFPPDTWKIHPYNGKPNLLKQLPKLLRGYRGWLPENYRIVILVDQDEEDCFVLKESILRHCQENGLEEKTLVRIIVVKLETWFLGDPIALESAFPRLRRRNIGGKAAYRNPEERPFPVEDLDRELREVGYVGYHKLEHSAEIAPHMTLQVGQNRAHSFNVFLTGIQVIV